MSLNDKSLMAWGRDFAAPAAITTLFMALVAIGLFSMFAYFLEPNGLFEMGWVAFAFAGFTWLIIAFAVVTAGFAAVAMFLALREKKKGAFCRCAVALALSVVMPEFIFFATGLSVHLSSLI